ncbi:hypothetical protein PR202_gb05799 [Eleusine coracana subsp. coracana]|uniref:Uncharacterized protein n=1 Tax=Eleusine coracana subsp. coracana TaxID=191504 RepID=A0AAV5E882_ELECO|nr:hypothetical protein PR202_gb05799 [Eleusine coracana subsp. coracana]
MITVSVLPKADLTHEGLLLGESPPLSLLKAKRQLSNKKQGPAVLTAQKTFGPGGVRRPYDMADPMRGH